MERPMKRATPQTSHKTQITYKSAVKNNDINSVLPDEILEEILILLKLSVTSIARLRTVCRKWKEIIQSTTFINKHLQSPSRKSWFLLLTASNQLNQQLHGYAYDYSLGIWHNFDIPLQIMTPIFAVASASGLICSIPKYENRKIYVYNPLTKLCKRIADRPTWNVSYSYFLGLSMSIGRNPRSYTVATISSSKLGYGYKLAIDVYSSDKRCWDMHREVIVQRQVSKRNCVICDGVLYIVVQSHALWAFDITSASSKGDLIQFPYSVGSMQVMNIKGKVVIATVVENQSVFLGIFISLLRDKELIHVATAPFECSAKLGMFRRRTLPMFQSCGFDEIIYIWNCQMRNIVMFDMVSGQWSWTSRRFSINADFLAGICFEPRFDTVP